MRSRRGLISRFSRPNDFSLSPSSTRNYAVSMFLNQTNPSLFPRHLMLLERTLSKALLTPTNLLHDIIGNGLQVTIFVQIRRAEEVWDL